MSTATTPPTVDFAAVTTRQQAMWASGDYSRIATLIHGAAETLADAADLRAGDRVLDVATGTGNLAIAAARCGGEVTGVDYVPQLMERGRARAAAEGLDIDFVTGDAQNLPFADGAFDAVVSIYGVMFVPDQERAAAEMLRVCRPGGTVALAAWTPEGFIGQLLRTVGSYVAPPPGLRSPIEWGREERIMELLGGEVTSLRTTRRMFTFRFRSPEEFVDIFRTWYGPTNRAFASLDEAGQSAMEADMLALARRFDRLQDGGPIAIPAEYLETVATRR